MTAFQWAILAGAIAGCGLWIIIIRLLPAHPNLAQTLAMFSAVQHNQTVEETRGWDAVGSWGIRKLPEKIRPIPTQDLALLSRTPAHFIAQKIAYALVGLLLPSVVFTVVILLGLAVPFVVPAVLALALAAVAFMVPDMEVRAKASNARVEFSRTLACFVNLVALERSCGSGTKQALDVAANVGDSWVFARLRESLDQATWAGLTSGDALRELSKDLGTTDLGEVADIITLSSNEGAGIYRILRAKARSIREGLLLSDTTRAHEANEKMSLPVSVLGIVFLAILIGPALLSMAISFP
ncbi:MAG: hypothetical protein LBG99_04715 [Propionibacteriaceae bacterium]|jgi:Flp pilus assembly protein TadB|nr:hypothetical protein [Propionibacteriaceae bacterium]